MNIERSKETSNKSFGKTVIQMLIGGAFGYGAVMVFDMTVGLDWMAKNLTAIEILAFAMAALFAMIAIIVLIMSFSKRAMTYNRAGGDMDDEEFAETQPINRWSSVAMLIYAAAFILLALGNTETGEPQIAYFWAVVACMVGQVAISWYLWRRYDELWREVTKQACAISFVVIEVVVFVWAAAAIFGLTLSFQPLAVVVASTATYTAITVWLTARKGMTE